MRKMIARFLKPTDYLIHCDMFNVERYPTLATVIDCGLRESLALNMAAGIANQYQTVYVYGVLGYIIHRVEQLKFSCKRFGSINGKIILFNAGRVGYERMGPGHVLDDDKQIMEIYDIKFYAPETEIDLIRILKEIDKLDNGMFYIQLGKDL